MENSQPLRTTNGVPQSDQVKVEAVMPSGMLADIGGESSSDTAEAASPPGQYLEGRRFLLVTTAYVSWPY